MNYYKQAFGAIVGYFSTYIDAAVVLGASGLQIVARHVVPNCLGALLVVGSYEIARIILLEASLGFLGLGIQPPTPSWGNMLANAQEMVFAAPMQALWPGAAIFITVVCCNVLGERLQRLA